MGSWRARYSQIGEVKARKQGVRPGAILDRHEQHILGLMAEQPDITLQEVVENLAREHHVMVCQATVWNFFDECRISFKKTLHADEQNRADVKAAREDWLEQQPELNPTQLSFADKTATSTKLVRHYGSSHKNVRCRYVAPHGRWETTTFTAGLRNDGIIAPLVIDGAMNGRTFRAGLSSAWHLN